MRIKKKHVLLESLLIDVSTEFTPVEKKIFKMLKKRYGHPIKKEEGKKEFNQWYVAAWLIETLDISYQDAYSLTKTYFWNYDKLFSEFESLRRKVSLPYLFFEHFRDLMEKFISPYEEPNNTYANVVIDFDRDSGFESNRDVMLWAGFRGFTLYIPMSTGQIGDRYIYTSETDPRTLIVTVKFYPIDKEGIMVDGYISDDDWNTKIDENQFIVKVEVKIGSDRTEEQIINDFMVFNVPYPKQLNYENFKTIVDGVANDVIEKIGKTVFNLHPSVGSINVNNQPDSQY